MAEPYHNFVNLLPNLARGEFPAGFPFFNIKPEENEKILRFYYPKESRPDPIGNSPVIIRKDLLEKIAPTWMNVSLRMKDDPETDITFGWELADHVVGQSVVDYLMRQSSKLQEYTENAHKELPDW
ncbi:hypothetical protein Tco_1305754, partial [Tanacetum coccineum]